MKECFETEQALVEAIARYKWAAQYFSYHKLEFAVHRKDKKACHLSAVLPFPRQFQTTAVAELNNIGKCWVGKDNGGNAVVMLDLQAPYGVVDRVTKRMRADVPPPSKAAPTAEVPPAVLDGYVFRSGPGQPVTLWVNGAKPASEGNLNWSRYLSGYSYQLSPLRASQFDGTIPVGFTNRMAVRMTLDDNRRVTEVTSKANKGFRYVAEPKVPVKA